MVRALSLLLVLALGACGRQPDAPQSASASLQLQVSADPLETRAYAELVAGFEAAHAGERVELQAIGKQKDHMAKLSTRFAGGDPPDLFVLNFRRYGQFAARGVIEPLGPPMQQRGLFDESEFFAPAVDAFRYGGSLQCLPQNVSSLVVYYNRALFQRYGVALPPPAGSGGWGWRQFADSARALTRSTEGDARPEIWGLGFDPSLARLLPFVWQAGGELVDDLDRPTRLRLGEPRAIQAMAFLKQLVASGRATPPLAEHRAEGPEARFARGALGMLLHSRRYTATLRSLRDLDWDVAPLPAGSRQATLLHSDAYCLSAASAHKERAYRFVAYALSEQGQAVLARSGRIVPSRRSVALSPAFLDPQQRPQSAQVFIDSLQHLHRTPNIAAWNEIETRVDPVVEEWFFETPRAHAEDPAVDARRLALQIEAVAQPLLVAPAP